MKHNAASQRSHEDKKLPVSPSGLFQKPGGPKIITIKHPTTGKAINFPSSQKSDREEAQDLPNVDDSLEPITKVSHIPKKGSPKPKSTDQKPSSERSRNKKLGNRLSSEKLRANGLAKAAKGKKSTRHDESQSSDITHKGQVVKAGSENTTKAASKVGDSSSWKPDVYVHAYVPEAFLAVNASPAILLSTQPVDGVDFAKYVSAFGATYFLDPLEVGFYPPTYNGSPVGSLENLRIETYKQHQSDCLILDLEAQIPEIRTYDMFGVQLNVVDRTAELYSLHVPGIQEGTPSVAYGDNIMVRQLVMDPRTELPLAAPASGSTGYQISAVVVGVDKQNEVLNLRVNGFTPHLLLCNVSFIVQTRLIKSIQRVVTDLSRELLDSSKYVEVSPVKEISVDVSFSGRDYGPIGTPIKSPAARGRGDSLSNAISPLKSPLTTRHDYFGAIGIPVRSPMRERPDYFSPMISTQQNQLTFIAKNPQSHDTLQGEKHSLPNGLAHVGNQGWLRRMMFPTEADGITQTSLAQGLFNRSWFDRQLNYEQKKAIDAILRKTYGSLGFLINGPPGTGKTKTIVETVIQLAYDSEFDGAILVCAPSDPAADTLALRLRHAFKPKAMFRLNDFSRTFAEVPQELLPYCYIDHDVFNLPPFKELMACKIVITTCRAADALIQARITNRDLVNFEMNVRNTINPWTNCSKDDGASIALHWWGLLVDEAAQATEPDMLIPLAVVTPPASLSTKPNPIFVMAGDQHQLGPRTYNKSTSLHVSLFERLSTLPLYANHPLARKSASRLSPPLPMLQPAFANLTRNYRSHPAILAIPSSLFYADTLIPEITADSLEEWPGWNDPGWPILFSCNGGIDDCETVLVPGGGGWYNKREAFKAIDYASNLIESGFITLPSEICIMSPFRAQVSLLRKVAREVGLWELNIGPMEAFQGLESRVVIICTTRTRRRFVEEDTMRGLGVVKEANKFNVAITRAKEGLVVLGNPWVLETDAHWLVFMEFCWRNNLWRTDKEGPDARMTEAGELDASDWAPKDGDVTRPLTGLENALRYKNQETADKGSEAVRRFMSERGEDEIWRSGVMAEAALLGDDTHSG